MVRPILQGGAPSPATIDCSPSLPGSTGNGALAVEDRLGSESAAEAHDFIEIDEYVSGV